MAENSDIDRTVHAWTDALQRCSDAVDVHDWRALRRGIRDSCRAFDTLRSLWLRTASETCGSAVLEAGPKLRQGAAALGDLTAALRDWHDLLGRQIQQQKRTRKTAAAYRQTGTPAPRHVKVRAGHTEPRPSRQTVRTKA